MNQKFSNYLRVLKISSGIGMLSIVGCAHELSPIKISPTNSPTTEISNQITLMNQAIGSQTDVLASAHFKKAESYLLDAQAENKKGDSTEVILESVGYSRAYLDKANEEASAVKSNTSDIAEARIAAISAGARNLPKELSALDDRFKRLTSNPDEAQKIKTEDKTKLQAQYLNLELHAIKVANLHEAESTLSLTKKKGAEIITPVAYKQAVEKLNNAEKVIETDRHNSEKISLAVKDATDSSRRVFALLESEQNSRSQTPEQRAMTLEARDMALNEAKAVTNEVAAESSVKDQQIAVQGEILALQGEDLAASEVANKVLKKKEMEDKMMTNAAAQFEKSEAEIYRQDGNLVIRLKTMNFATNRSDLPAASIAILTRVKDVMKEIGAGEVIVEGHTDAVGDATHNQELSLKRAQAVVKFFESDKSLAEDKIDSVGFGYSKPLSFNKTKEGRAQNRRVDIVIKTNPVRM